VIDRIVDGARENGLTAAAIYGGISKPERARIVRDFQNGDLDVVAINYLSGGTGLTLTASNRVVVAELPWKAMELSQAEDRTHRIGQERPVTSQFVLFQGGIDDRMMELISQKAQSQKDVVGVAKANDLTSEGAFNADMLEFLISGKREKSPAEVSYDTWRLARGQKGRRYIVDEGNVGVTQKDDAEDDYDTTINMREGREFDLLRDAQAYVISELDALPPQTDRMVYEASLRHAIDPGGDLGPATAPVVVVDEPAPVRQKRTISRKGRRKSATPIMSRKQTASKQAQLFGSMQGGGSLFASRKPKKKRRRRAAATAFAAQPALL